MAENVQWVATLSNGETAVEHVGKYQITPGERKPWVKLCEFAADQGLHLTSLRLNHDGRTIHMPRDNFGRFSMNETSQAPKSYSLQYHIEGDMENGGILNETLFVDMAAHYDDFIVHYIQDVTNNDTSWVIVTKGAERLAQTPSS